ncbi:hypothetical protein HMPREF0208_02562 [Citrobacter koseri]|nr:hypothetical protein HMPREF0208_02562 [Citrobacter koseri]
MPNKHQLNALVLRHITLRISVQHNQMLSPTWQILLTTKT